MWMRMEALNARQKEMLSPLVSAAMLSPLPGVGKQLDGPGRAGRQAGTGELCALFVLLLK